MLFLYRPRQTWMPFHAPRVATDQDQYRYHLQEEFEATHQVPPATPSVEPSPEDPLAQLRALAKLRDAGALTDAEFTAAKAKVIGIDEEPT